MACCLLGICLNTSFIAALKTEGGTGDPFSKSHDIVSLAHSEGKKSKWSKAKDTISLRSVFRSKESKEKRAFDKAMSKSETNLAYGGDATRMSLQSMPVMPADRRSMAYSVSSQGSEAYPDNLSIATSVMIQDGAGMPRMVSSREPSIAPDQQSLAPSIMIEDETGRSRMLRDGAAGRDVDETDRTSVAPSIHSRDVSPDDISIAPSVMTVDSQGMKQVFDSRAPSIAPDQSSIAPSVAFADGQSLARSELHGDGQSMNMLFAGSTDPSPTGSGRSTRTASPSQPDQASVAPTLMTQDGQGMRNLFGSREPSIVSDAHSIGPAEDAEFLSRMGKARSVSRVGEMSDQYSTADGVSMRRMFSTPRPSNYDDTVSIGRESVVTVRAADTNRLKEPSVHFSEFSAGHDRQSIAPSTKSEGKKSLKSILSKGTKTDTPVGNGAVAQTDCVIEMDNVPLVEGQTSPEAPQDAPAKPLKESKIKSTLIDAGKDGKKGTKQKRKDLIADLDWWSKYYATKQDIERVITLVVYFIFLINKEVLALY